MKKAFQLYHDWGEAIRLLDNEAAGRLLKLIYRHENGETPIPDKDLILPFTFIKQQLDRDRAKYEERCKKNQQNIRKRWDYEDIQTYSNHTDTDTDTVTDIDTDTDTVTGLFSNEKDNLRAISFSEYKKLCGNSREPPIINAMDYFIDCETACLMEHRRMTVAEWNKAADEILDDYQFTGNGVECMGKYTPAQFEEVVNRYFQKGFDDYSIPHFNSKNLKAVLLREVAPEK